MKQFVTLLLLLISNFCFPQNLFELEKFSDKYFFGKQYVLAAPKITNENVCYVDVYEVVSSTIKTMDFSSNLIEKCPNDSLLMSDSSIVYDFKERVFYKNGKRIENKLDSISKVRMIYVAGDSSNTPLLYLKCSKGKIAKIYSRDSLLISSWKYSLINGNLRKIIYHDDFFGKNTYRIKMKSKNQLTEIRVENHDPQEHYIYSRNGNLLKYVECSSNACYNELYIYNTSGFLSDIVCVSNNHINYKKFFYNSENRLVKEILINSKYTTVTDFYYDNNDLLIFKISKSRDTVSDELVDIHIYKFIYKII